MHHSRFLLISYKLCLLRCRHTCLKAGSCLWIFVVKSLLSLSLLQYMPLSTRDILVQHNYTCFPQHPYNPKPRKRAYFHRDPTACYTCPAENSCRIRNPRSEERRVGKE